MLHGFSVAAFRVLGYFARSQRGQLNGGLVQPGAARKDSARSSGIILLVDKKGERRGAVPFVVGTKRGSSISGLEQQSHALPLELIASLLTIGGLVLWFGRPAFSWFRRSIWIPFREARTGIPKRTLIVQEGDRRATFWGDAQRGSEAMTRATYRLAPRSRLAPPSLADGPSASVKSCSLRKPCPADAVGKRRGVDQLIEQVVFLIGHFARHSESVRRSGCSASR